VLHVRILGSKNIEPHEQCGFIQDILAVARHAIDTPEDSAVRFFGLRAPCLRNGFESVGIGFRLEMEIFGLPRSRRVFAHRTEELRMVLVLQRMRFASSMNKNKSEHRNHPRLHLLHLIQFVAQ
jgi:hypothetical protein